VPFKRPNCGQLSLQQKQFNLLVRWWRATVEHFFGFLKRYSILSGIWRGRLDDRGVGRLRAVWCFLLHVSAMHIARSPRRDMKRSGVRLVNKMLAGDLEVTYEWQYQPVVLRDNETIIHDPVPEPEAPALSATELKEDAAAHREHALLHQIARQVHAAQAQQPDDDDDDDEAVPDFDVRPVLWQENPRFRDYTNLDDYALE